MIEGRRIRGSTFLSTLLLCCLGGLPFSRASLIRESYRDIPLLSFFSFPLLACGCREREKERRFLHLFSKKREEAVWLCESDVVGGVSGVRKGEEEGNARPASDAARPGLGR